MSVLPLQVQALSKTFGQLDAVKSLSFDVQPGEIFGLLGPNGAGKTTTIGIITTLEVPTSGVATVFGYDVCKNALEAKRRLGVVHQEVIHSGFFTIEELLGYQSGYYGLRKNQERINYLLDRLGLHEHRHKKVKQLSGGMKRRLMIGKALVHSPKLLLLDEPTAGVDLTLRENLWDFVRELRAEGVAILLTTHYLEEAELLCDRVGIINRGRLEAVGPTREIVSEFTRKKVVVETFSRGRLETFVGMHTPVSEVLATLQVPASDLKDLTILEGTLEEAFRQVLNRTDESRRTP